MYIVFIDESGQPGGYNQNKQTLVEGATKYFVFAGFMIDGNDLININKN